VKNLDFDVVAIDITSSMPSICIGNINKAGQIQSKAQVCVECSGIKKGVIEDLETVTVSLSQMIKAVKTQYGIDTRSAFINVPCYMCKISYHSVTEDIYNKEIDDEIVQKIKSKLLSAPRHEGYTVIDIALTKFMLDSNLETRDPLGKFANRLSASANIISIKTEYFEILKNLFEKLGMQMDGIVMNTLSGLSLLPFSDSERSNVVVLNISREITDITVCQFGKIAYVDTIFAGAKNIIKDVSIGLNISPEDAEKVLRNYPIADPQYIIQDIENSVKTASGESITFMLSDMVTFVRDRILDIYDICLERLEQEGILLSKDYKICIYGSDIEKYSGYMDLAQQVFDIKIKKIPYALFEVEDICYGAGCGMIRYISQHPLLRKESKLHVKHEPVFRKKKSSLLKKFIGFLKID
jgi:cell division protein FtsA